MVIHLVNDDDDDNDDGCYGDGNGTAGSGCVMVLVLRGWSPLYNFIMYFCLPVIGQNASKWVKNSGSQILPFGLEILNKLSVTVFTHTSIFSPETGNCEPLQCKVGN